MRRSRFKNVFNKICTSKTWDIYQKQKHHNFSLNTLRKTMNEYFENIYVTNVADNKKFQKIT